MGVVRIDDSLDKEIDSLIKSPENRFRYPSKSAFLNIIINDYLESQRQEAKQASKKR
ncbi:hypothetical protein KY363_01135 [Candidatus Woesearchaeota archaeon]|nr:hypothetical protein [Candidatus Woesearchaeota archaeon]